MGVGWTKDLKAKSATVVSELCGEYPIAFEFPNPVRAVLKSLADEVISPIDEIFASASFFRVSIRACCGA